MNREEYLSYIRSGNDLMIMYKHYVKEFNEKKHSPFLNVNDFSQLIQMWPGFMFLGTRLKQLYNEHFKIMLLYNSSGELINYL